MNLGNTIKILRKKKGLQQIELAKLCKLSQTYLSQIENNQKEPNISTLKQIALNLNIPLPFIFILSLDEADIPEQKRKIFDVLSPSIKNILNELIEPEPNENSGDKNH